MVTRDDDLLSKVPSTVALTITTLDAGVAKVLEPNAPPPRERLRAAEYLVGKGIPVSVRIDPVIPLLNDKQETLIAELASIGVKHITSSTYKIKPDNWRRFAAALPSLAEKLKPLYFKKGEKMGGSTLLPRDLRFKLLKSMHDLAAASGMKFGVCREGLTQLNTAACDGSWMMPAEHR